MNWRAGFSQLFLLLASGWLIFAAWFGAPSRGRQTSVRSGHQTRSAESGQEPIDGFYEHHGREWLLDCVVGAESACRPEIAPVSNRFRRKSR